jgi:hypothetical protein
VVGVYLKLSINSGEEGLKEVWEGANFNILEGNLLLQEDEEDSLHEWTELEDSAIEEQS